MLNDSLRAYSDQKHLGSKSGGLEARVRIGTAPSLAYENSTTALCCANCATQNLKKEASDSTKKKLQKLWHIVGLGK